MTRSFFTVCILLFSMALPCFAGPVAIEPAGSPYASYILYQALVLFWIGIIGLIVIIVMKLKEAKRIQDMDVHKDDENAPFLD
jgi:hypothetical protein